MHVKWAERMTAMYNPAVSEVLRTAANPRVIAFAAGSPSAEAFPVAELSAAFQAVLAEMGPSSLQYGVTEGYQPLREWVASRCRRRGIACGPENVLITSGSQQALDFLGRAILEPGDYVAVESPTYLAALQAFRGSQARFIAIPMDEQGMCVDVLAQEMKRHRPKFIYTIPNFQNPTGITMSEKRRQELAALAQEHEIPVVEDDPYGELRYSGTDVPPVKSFGGDAVLYTGTASKIIAPGLRVGWLVAAEPFVTQATIVKQASDVLTNALTQRAVHRYVTDNDIDRHIAQIIDLYRERLQVMLTAMRQHFPATATWTQPAGGMFVWVTLPEKCDTAAILPRAVAKGVAYVPGPPFFPDESGRHYMRLNFSNCSIADIKDGISRLGALLCTATEH